MRTLALDLGNSTLFAGVFEDGRLLRSVRIDVGRGLRTPPTQAVSGKAGSGDPALQNHFIADDVLIAALKRFVRGKIDRIALCSVVPDRTAPLATAVRDTLGVAPLILTAAADHGLKIGYRHPHQLGPDRIATVLGARKLHPQQNVIVVDCGTATTITVADRDGVLHGGAILPGLGLWPAMLAQRTARLPAVTLRAPTTAVARDTAAAIRSGVIIGHAGAIRELVARSRAEVFGRQSVTVLGTGGMVTHLKGQRLFTALEPGLILHGLDFFVRQDSAHA
jgi:type III pantothenate kinase